MLFKEAQRKVAVLTGRCIHITVYMNLIIRFLCDQTAILKFPGYHRMVDRMVGRMVSFEAPPSVGAKIQRPLSK